MDQQAQTPRAGATIQEPTTSLNQLFKQFRQSASNPELDEASQVFAARLCVLTRHLQVIAARQAMLAVKDETQQKQLAAFIEALSPIVQQSAGVEAAAQPEPASESRSIEPSAGSEESQAATARQGAKQPAPAPPAPQPTRSQAPTNLARRQTAPSSG